MSLKVGVVVSCKALIIGKNDPVSRELFYCLNGCCRGYFSESSRILDPVRNREVLMLGEIILINLIAVSEEEGELLHVIKAARPEIPVVAIHTFDPETNIKLPLSSGYDAYISVFEFNSKVEDTLRKLIESFSKCN